MGRLYIGLDVQVRRPCACAVVDGSGTVVDSAWFASAAEGTRFLKPLAADHDLHIGIDAPRVPISEPRKWYWNGLKKTWRKRAAADKGMGRHCEIAVKAHNLANPQWTPMGRAAPEWMRLGFGLFQTFDAFATTYEAFPSASYTMLEGDSSLGLTVNFAAMKPGKTDMLDAWMAAATVREFVEGRGVEVGGGDGLGAIILPRRLADPIDAVLNWPG